MSERREETRKKDDALWDKTFTDDQDLGSDGHLSRTEHRRQREHNSMITTILIILIIILAAAPVIYWVNHKNPLNHPVRSERVAQSATNSKKKAVSHSTHTHKEASSHHSASQSSSLSSSSSSSMSSSSSAVSSSSQSTQRWVTVPRNGSLYRVAANNGISVQELMRLNGLTPNARLRPGQQLRVR